MHLGRHIQVQDVQQCRHDVGQAHRVWNRFGYLRYYVRAGPMNDQRHVKRRIVDKKTMRLFAVLTEALTVISGEDDDCVLVQMFFFQKVD